MTDRNRKLTTAEIIPTRVTVGLLLLIHSCMETHTYYKWAKMYA